MLCLRLYYLCVVGTLSARKESEGDKDLKLVVVGIKEEKDNVGLPKPGLTMSNPALSASQCSLRSNPDYDSSATLSADEGPPTLHVAPSHSDSTQPSTGLADRPSTTLVPVSQVGTAHPGGGSLYQDSKMMLMASTTDSSIPAGLAVRPNYDTADKMSQPARQPSVSSQPPTTLTASTSGMEVKTEPRQPACVRDLIHSAIERNIAHDLSIPKSKAYPG